MKHFALISFFILAIHLQMLNCHRIKVNHKIEDHIHAKEHNAAVDHEAFLGNEESKNFKKLSPEESKERLRSLIEEKVDLNRDDFVTEQELSNWISLVSHQSKQQEVDHTFKMYINGSDEQISYDKYFARTYGSHNEEDLDEESILNLHKMKMQDDRKWKFVDENKDGLLNKEEFRVFLHPEEFPRMKSLVVDEALEVSDKNGDGVFDVEEYLHDLWPPSETNRPDSVWLDQERDTFSQHRDLDHDGRLDRTEIGEWLMPTEYDPVRAETQHLLAEADSDKDGRLSMDEIMGSHDTFAGSQATDYGNRLQHEDL